MDILRLDSSETLHLRFCELRLIRGATILTSLEKVSCLLPPAAIVTMISYSRGNLNDISHAYTKVLRCCGVWKCPNCAVLKRPTIVDLDSLLVRPKQGTRVPRCTVCTDQILTYISCAGRFIIKRQVDQTSIVLVVDDACGDHPLPPRIRQTAAERERLAASIKAHGKVPIAERDPAGMTNSELHRKRVYRAKCKAHGVSDAGMILKELSDLGEYSSSSSGTKLLITAPYEKQVVTRGSTLFLDSTYKVVGPPTVDYRSEAQLFCVSAKSSTLQLHVILRGLFTKPSTRAEYRFFFRGIFETHGLPSTNSYYGFVADFCAVQMQAFILEFTEFRHRKKKNSNRMKRFSAIRNWSLKHFDIIEDAYSIMRRHLSKSHKLCRIDNSISLSNRFCKRCKAN